MGSRWVAGAGVPDGVGMSMRGPERNKKQGEMGRHSVRELSCVEDQG